MGAPSKFQTRRFFQILPVILQILPVILPNSSSKFRFLQSSFLYSSVALTLMGPGGHLSVRERGHRSLGTLRKKESVAAEGWKTQTDRITNWKIEWLE